MTVLSINVEYQANRVNMADFISTENKISAALYLDGQGCRRPG
jgi:hypothetical protein